MKKEMIEVDVHIPSNDGESVAYTIKARVAALYDADYEDYILDGDALKTIENVKARHMGLLLPEDIKALRARLDLTQKEISELLQIGEKTWSRWENGRERPSRSMNILIRSLNDGKIDPNYLSSLSSTSGPEWSKVTAPRSQWKKEKPFYPTIPPEDYTDPEFEHSKREVA